jgi:uncharacterized membrane protein
MLLPYVFIMLLVLAFLASLAQALLLPFFLHVCALFNAVAASANTKDEERLQAVEKTILLLQEGKNDEERRIVVSGFYCNHALKFTKVLV